MLAAHPLHQRSSSCPPQECRRPVATLHRSHSSHDLTTALRQIDLVDLLADKREGVYEETPSSRKQRPRHARMWSLKKRKSRSLDRHASLIEQTNKAKRQKQSEYVVSPSSSLLQSPGPIMVADAIPRSPSTINLLDLATPALQTANGFKSIASISACVSPTSTGSDDPAAMYMQQAKKLERRLQSEAMRLGATAVANSTITAVDDFGSMAASGIAVIVTAP